VLLLYDSFVALLLSPGLVVKNMTSRNCSTWKGAWAHDQQRRFCNV